MPMRRIASYKSVLDLPSIASPFGCEPDANCGVWAQPASCSGQEATHTHLLASEFARSTSGRVPVSPDSAQTVIVRGDTSDCQIPKIRFKRNAEAAFLLSAPVEADLPVLLTPPQKRIRASPPRIKVKGPSLRTLVKEWVLAIDLGVDTEEETIDLALHLFSRYITSPQGSPSGTPEVASSLVAGGDVLKGEQRKAELAACMWMGMKLDGLQVDAPCVYMVSKATGCRAVDVLERELEVASALDWKLMDGWVRRVPGC